MLYFFFSSRRRHTRLVSDWSSDVCSSDLGEVGVVVKGEPIATIRAGEIFGEMASMGQMPRSASAVEIGRASCRERVKVRGAGGTVNKKNHTEVREDVRRW